MSGDLFSLRKDLEHLKDSCPGRQKGGLLSLRLEVVSHPKPGPHQGFKNKRLFLPLPPREPPESGRSVNLEHWRQQVQHRCGKSSSAHPRRLHTSTSHTAPCIIQSVALLGGRTAGRSPARKGLDRRCATWKELIMRETVCSSLSILASCSTRRRPYPPKQARP